MTRRRQAVRAPGNVVPPWPIDDHVGMIAYERLRYVAVPANGLEVGERGQQILPDQLAPCDELPFRSFQGRLVIEQFNLFQWLATIDA